MRFSGIPSAISTMIAVLVGILVGMVLTFAVITLIWGRPDLWPLRVG